jgi:hypothetical protein
MMSIEKTWQDKFVKCPYYQGTDKNKIVCEGFVEHTRLAFIFTNDSDRRHYLEGICSGIKGCTVCPINKMLTNIYEALYEE